MRMQTGCLCVSLLAMTAAQAGVVVHMARKNSPTDQPKDHEIVYVQDGLLRIDELDAQGHVQDLTLFRDGTIWKVDVQKHTFQKFDKNAMRRSKTA